MARTKQSTGMVYMLEHWGMIAGGLIVTGSVLAGAYGGISTAHDLLQKIDANTDNIVLVGERLESKIVQDNMKDIRQRQWELEKNYGGNINKAPGVMRDEYRRLGQERADLERQLQETRSAVQQKQQTK